MALNTNDWSLGERFNGLKNLAKQTFTIVGRDKDIIHPWVRMVVYTAVQMAFFFGALYFLFTGGIGTGILGLFVWFCLSLYRAFYFNYQETRQSWLVYETLKGNDRSFSDAVERTGSLGAQIRILALIDIAMAFVRSQSDNQSSGIMDFIFDLIIAGLMEVWDLANHYLLPAVAIDEVSISEGVESMKRLKDEVPESLAGIFGIDFIGNIARMITLPLHIIMFLAAVAMSLFLSDFMPAATIVDFSETFGAEFAKQVPGDEGSWLPLLVLVFSSSLIGGVIKRSVTSIKVIYFTIFYMKITHEDQIIPEIRENLTSYLRLEEEEKKAQKVASQVS